MAIRGIFAFALTCTLVLAQSAPEPPREGVKSKPGQTDKKPKQEPERPPKRASIEGIVLGEDTGRPLRRAQVALKPTEGGAGYSQETDDKGNFSFPDVLPGTYSITAQRDGYLPAYAARVSGARLPPIFTVREGARLNDMTVRLQPWGVIAGKVKFDDGEPAIDVAIQLYREYFYRGLHGYSVASAGRTNDRGEYRIHGQGAGTYYVAALYQRPVILKDAEEPQRKRPDGTPLPELRYAITFYPSATKLGDAVAVRLNRGQELNVVDIFLAPVPTVRVRGQVRSGLSGQMMPNPAISLRRADASDTASMSAPVDLGFDRDGSFVLKGVVPGSYYFLLDGSEDTKALTARQLVAVGEAGLEELSIVMKLPAVWKGSVSIVGESSTALKSLRVVLEPRRTTARRTSANVEEWGLFSLAFIPGETYDLFVDGADPDTYLKSARLGSLDVLAEGLRSETGDDPGLLQIVLATDGGKMAGRALTQDNTVASGATVMLIPDLPRGRLQSYKTSYADESGIFYFRGIAPGRYLLVAFLDEQPCEVYDPDSIGICRSKGSPVEIATEGQTNVEIKTAR